MAGGMKPHLAIHGHFYQPPREDPFTGLLPREKGADPYRNFNEKIAAECYGPNAEVGNFARISFDLGPTLASWLERYTPKTYAAIVAQARAHFLKYGHPNAMAQVYSHASCRWPRTTSGRFRSPGASPTFNTGSGTRRRACGSPRPLPIPPAWASCWITASSTPSSPRGRRPPRSIRPQPYWVRLNDGRRIAAFFYNGDLSGRVSFDSTLTTNADVFGLQDLPRHINRDHVAAGDQQLVLIATDGELYGHHLTYRDKFLAHLLEVSAISRGFEVTSLGRYLADNPPTREVKLAEATSWSCHHGVDRWRGDCLCIVEDGEWKWYLRQALTRLAVKIDTLYDPAASRLLPRCVEGRGGVHRRAAWGDHLGRRSGRSMRAIRRSGSGEHWHCWKRSTTATSCSPAAPGSSRIWTASSRATRFVTGFGRFARLRASTSSTCSPGTRVICAARAALSPAAPAPTCWLMSWPNRPADGSGLRRSKTRDCAPWPPSGANRLREAGQRGRGGGSLNGMTTPARKPAPTASSSTRTTAAQATQPTS